MYIDMDYVNTKNMKAFEAWVSNLSLNDINCYAIDWAYDNDRYSYNYDFMYYLKLEYIKHVNSLLGVIA